MFPQPDPWWYSIRAALSWVMELLIDGFAACGASMQPGFFQPPDMDYVDQPGPDTAPRSGHPADQVYPGGRSYPDEWITRPGYRASPDETRPRTHQDRAITAASTDPEDLALLEAVQTAASRWIALVTSPLARVLSKSPPELKTSPMIQELDALDDRTLRDIGISPYVIDRLARHGNYIK